MSKNVFVSEDLRGIGSEFKGLLADLLKGYVKSDAPIGKNPKFAITLDARDFRPNFPIYIDDILGFYMPKEKGKHEVFSLLATPSILDKRTHIKKSPEELVDIVRNILEDSQSVYIGLKDFGKELNGSYSKEPLETKE